MNRQEFDNTVNAFLDFLEEALPNADSTHRDEVFDIAELLRQRVNTFVNSYGLN